MKPNSLKPLIILLVAALCFAPLTSLPSAAQAQGNTFFEQTECFEEVKDIEGAVCGYVSVPEFHAKPEGKRIKLAVAKLPALNGAANNPPLIMAQGGPGGAGIKTFAQFAAAPPISLLRQDRDVVLFDQRGTYYSQPRLDCPAYFDLSVSLLEREVSPEERTRLAVEALSACKADYEAQGIDLSAFNSYENAADVPFIMLDALGYSSYDFYGVSYGTLLGQHVMAVAPRGLRSAILDANVPRQANFITAVPQNAWSAMQRFFKACAADKVCDAANPNLEATFLKTVEALNAQPATVTLTDPETDKSYKALITGDVLVSVLFQMLYATSLYPQLPSFLTSAANGDFAWAESLLPQFVFDRTMSYGMYTAVVCAEEADFTAADFNVEGVPSTVAEAMLQSGKEILATCEAWKLPKLPAEANTPVNSNTPTFVISGEFDPITPPNFGDIVAKSLRNAFHVVYPATGHGILGLPCPGEMVAAFLADTSKQPDASCVGEMVLRFPAPVAEIELEPITYENIRTLAPKGWENPQPGVYASGPSVVLFDIRDGDDPVAILRAQLGDQLPSEPVATVEASDLKWSIYQVEPPAAQGFQLLIAATTKGGKVYIVLVQGTSEDISTLAERVLQLILNNFTIN
ncbi:MAG: alpha/beta hydrolase [Anaerolineae bacterium]|nr:alpha/beta hydrolase [Anaerolineae bacterium]